MKTRLGFVSNSSSSSFCLYGIFVGTDVNFGTADLEFLRNNNLAHIEGKYNEMYVGREWKNIGDNETGAQFKKSIQEACARRWPDKKCSTHEEGWYDG